jgi:hypothetical protein
MPTYSPEDYEHWWTEESLAREEDDEVGAHIRREATEEYERQAIACAREEDDEVGARAGVEDEDELTPGLICQTSSDIRDGKADPEQARRLLRHFLDCTERRRPDQKVLPDPLLEFFRHVFAVYLKDPRPGNLEKLLGLTRQGRGRPINPETAENYHMIAWEVLRRHLEGKSFSNAVLDASVKFSFHERNVQDIWKDHKRVALNLEAVSRALEASDKKARWTDEEKNA